jgi:chromosome segregation ATPase
MKPNNNANQNQQHSQQDQQNQQTQEPSMNPPEAAAKADLRRVEEEAKSGREEAENARERVESLEEQVAELEEENEELRDFLGRVIGSVRRVDRHLDSIEENIGAWGNSYKTEPIAEMYGLPEPNGPESEDEQDGEDDEIVLDDAEPETIEVPYTDAEEV